MYQYSYKEIISTFKFIEQSFPIETLKYKNICIWPFIKADINYQLLENTNKKISEQQLPNPFKTTKQKLGDVLASRKQLKKAKKEYRDYVKKQDRKSLQSIATSKSIIFLSFSSHKNQKIEGKYFNTQSDTFLSTVKNTEDVCVLEFTARSGIETSVNYSKSHKADILKKRAEITQSKMILKKYIHNLFFSSETPDNNTIEFFNFLNKNEIDISFNYDNYCYHIDFILSLKKEFISLYQKLKPQYVITPVYYSHESFASTLACRELNICSIEMQHGVYPQAIYSYYNSFNNFSGFELLPKYFFSWDKFQSALINKWAINTKNHKSITYGINPIHFWRKNKSKFLNNDLDDFFSKASNEKTIKALYTISDNVNDKLADIIKETEGKVFWFIRNHPRAHTAPFVAEFLKKVKENNSTNFEIEISSKTPLYTLLSKIDIHVTSISSVVCECIDLGIPNIVIDESGYAMYGEVYTNEPLVEYCFNTEEIVRKLIRFSKKPLSQKDKKEVFFGEFVKQLD